MLERVQQQVNALEVAKMRAASRTERRIALQEEERLLAEKQRAMEKGELPQEVKPVAPQTSTK
jgi:hypothetical protein